MANDGSVKVVFGADTSGLDAQIAIAKAQLKSFNDEVRKLAKEAASGGGATNDNLGSALKSAAVSASAARREVDILTQAVRHAKEATDGHTNAVIFNKGQMGEAVHVFRAVTDEVAAGRDLLGALSVETGRIIQIFQMGQGGVINQFKALAGTIASVITPARVMAGTVVGALLGIALEAGKAGSAIMELGHIQEQVGMNASRILAISAATATGGMGREDTVKALQAANRQFQQFSTGGGEVLDTLKRIGADFIQDAQLAHDFSEWLVAIGNGIRTLDDAAARDLAAKVFGGEEAGRVFLEQIKEGKIDIDELNDAAEKAGTTIIDGPAKSVEELKKKITAASEEADQKMLVAFGNWAHPLLEAERIIIRIKTAIANAAIALQGLNKDMTGAQGESISAYERRLGLTDPGEKAIPPWSPLALTHGNAKTKTWSAAKAEWMSSGPEMATITKADDHFSEHEGGGARRSGRSGASDALSALQKNLDGQIDAVRSASEAKQKIWEEDVKLFKLTEGKKLELARQELDSEFKAELALMNKELALAGLTAAKKADIQKRVDALKAKHAADIVAIGDRERERVVEGWNQTIDTMRGKLSESVMGLLQGTSTIKEVFKEFATTIVQSVVDSLTKTLANSLKGVLNGILSSLSEGAGGSIIGGIGKLLAGLAFFDKGAYELPSTQLAVVHQGEMIVPAAPAAAFRNMLENGGGTVANSAGSPTYNISPAIHLNISAMDGRSVHDTLMANRGAVMQAVGKMIRDGAHLGVGALNPR